MMRRIKAFIMGMREWSTDWTLSYDDPALMASYDRGRYFMWRIHGREV